MKIIKHLLERRFLFLAIFWTIGILIGSLARINSIPNISIVGNDKMVHFIFYFVLFLLWFVALNRKKKENRLNFCILIFILIFGIIIEVLQGMFTQNRQADFSDIVANFGGVLLGFFVVKTFRFKK
ncbi:VanZ family protein [Flavobacterium cucumis]|uniref:VanZ family protein n=1 Tax=Flavobacterium cucumis TaxID=416016 RepID=UPI000935BDCB|nr:VanZ family protein [Flavobacterium cucumis]